MWAQVKIKRTLAWSTVSQMGFTMVQVGLAAFPAAVLMSQPRLVGADELLAIVQDAARQVAGEVSLG